MELLRTYNKSDDFLGGEVSLGILHQEIIDSGSVDGLKELQCEGNDIKIYGTSILDQESLDAVIANHDYQYIRTESGTNTFTLSTVSVDVIVGKKTIIHPAIDFNILGLMTQCEAMYSEEIQKLVDDGLATVKINGVVKTVFHPMRTI